MTAPERLVVLAPNWLGDAVMALPLVADICRGWPDTHVTVAARDAIAALFRMVDEVNDVLTLAGGGGLRAIAAAPDNARALHGGEFDAALLLPNSFLSAWIASRAGIPARWGYRTDLRGALLTHAIRRPGNKLHQAQYYQALGAALGLPAGPLVAHVNVGPEPRERARLLLEESGLRRNRPFVAMAPGAAYGRAKQWLPERFAELAATLARERDTATVLVGTRADTPVCQEVVARSGVGPGTVIDVSGRTDLEALASVLALARAVVANDSGAMHVAGAVGTKVIAVFGATNEAKTAPLAASAAAPAATVVGTNVWCRPCMLRECPIDHRCMTGVTARMVYEAYETSSVS